MAYTDESASCVACGKIGVDLHHIRSRSVGGSDDPSNLLPVCRTHHTRIHARGLIQVSEENTGIMEWLLRNGWKLTFINGRGKWSRM